MKLRGIGIFAIGCFAALMVQFVPSAIAQQGSRFNDLPDVTVSASSVTLIRAANSARLVLVCSNNDAVNGVRIGGTTTTATRGMRAAPASTFMVTGTADIYGFAEGGAPVVSCSEEIR